MQYIQIFAKLLLHSIYQIMQPWKRSVTVKLGYLIKHFVDKSCFYVKIEIFYLAQYETA